MMTKMNKLFFLIVLIIPFIACVEDEGSTDHIDQFDSNKFYEEKWAWDFFAVKDYSYRLYVTVDSAKNGRSIVNADVIVKDGVSDVAFRSSDDNYITDDTSPYCLKTIEAVYDFIFDLYMQEQNCIYNNAIGSYSIDWTTKYDEPYHYPSYFVLFPIHCYPRFDNIYISVEDFKLLD